MDKNSSTRHDLFEKLDYQDQLLRKYKAKLGDLLASYHSLKQEKDALEASVKSLSAKPSASSTDIQENSDEINPPSEVGGKDARDASSELDERIATLASSLSTVTQEKSRMEANFQADKRKILQEKEEREKKFNEEVAHYQRKYEQCLKQIQELKTRLRSQQNDLDKEQNSHKSMLLELQTGVTDERSKREMLENELENAHFQLALRDSQLDQYKEYQKKSLELAKEVESLRNQLRDVDAKEIQPPPLLLKLQQEMAEIKSQHQIAVDQEQRRVNEAEERLRQVEATGEDRATMLESRLAELSDTVGSYDRQRQQDQIAIKRLKERVSQLALENKSLSQAASAIGLAQQWQRLNEGDQAVTLLQNVDEDEDDSNLDIQALVEKITRLQGLLKLANQRSEKPLDLTDLFIGSSTSGKESHTKCHEELLQLKEEFERYKSRAQAMLKNKSNKDDDNDRAMGVLRDQVEKLTEKLEEARAQLENCERKQRASAADVEWRSQLLELEKQMQKQRERSFTLIQEKNDELKILRSQLAVHSKWDMTSGDNVNEVTEELSRAMLEHKEPQLLHYAQELSRRDVEITTLRKGRHQLEATLRDLQNSFRAKEERYTDRLEALEDQAQHLQRNASREGANLEYLKNVVLSYMLSSSLSSRQHMLNAIAAVLKFSGKELEAVRQYNSTWWWNPNTS